MIPHDTRTLDAVLMPLEPFLGREAGHADVVASFPVTVRVPEEDDVDGVMPFRKLRSWPG
jgi:hypothetical protein